MKIAYLPSKEIYSPEFQHFAYFSKVAAQNGCDTRMCFTSEEITDYDPDFVFVFGPFSPKLTEHLHYGLMQSPMDYMIGWPGGLMNVYSWDGYLTTAKATAEWLTAIAEKKEGAQAPAIGHFFVTGDLQPYEETYQPKKLVYAGNGWDGRGIDLCRYLYEELGDAFEIYGAPEKWRPRNNPAYQCFLEHPSELLNKYRSAVCLSISGVAYLRDDIMTTRMHEASSVGGMTITPESPATREMYGDNLYYYDGFASEEEQARQIIARFLEIQVDPLLQTRRRAAHELFNNVHSLTAQFPKLLEYHAYMKNRADAKLQRKKLSGMF